MRRGLWFQMCLSWYSSGGWIIRLLYSVYIYFSCGGVLQVVMSAAVWGSLGSVRNVILVSCCELINKNIYLCDGNPFILFVSTTNRMHHFKIMNEVIKSNLVLTHDG
jgi:hypothetical protein